MSLEIVAEPKVGLGPLWVNLMPEVKGIEGPLSFEWSFGDGKVSNEKDPGLHLFEFGKYSVILEVTDKRGRKYTASVTVDASSPG